MASIIMRFCKSCNGVKELSDGMCPDCGKDIAPRAVDKVDDVMGFRPHYNRSIGEFVTSEDQMRKVAEKKGLERYGAPIQMRRG